MDQAYEAIMKMFERTKKDEEFTYTTSDIKNHFASYREVCLMEFRNDTQDYINHGLNGIIKNLCNYLNKKQ